MDPPESLRPLLELTQDKIVVIDAGGIYRYANPATERLLGYDVSEFVGTSAFSYIHPDDRGRVRAAFDRLVEADTDRTDTVQFRHRAADGSWVWLESRMGSRTDSDLGGYVVSSRDVTARKEAERRRRETETRLRQLAANTDDVLWMFSGDWEELLFVNDAFEDVWGLPRGELEADPERFLDGIHPEDRTRARRAMERLSAGEPIEIEYRVNADREYRRWVWVRGRPIVEDDEVVRIVGFSRDVTDRRRRQRQLRVLDTLLRHNLRNAMNVVLGHADLARDRGDGDIEACMDAIIETGTELLGTVEKERRIVEVLSGPNEPTAVDLRAIVEECLEGIDSDVRVRTDLTDASVRAVPEIRAAVEELLSNAVEHACGTPKIGVRIEREPETACLFVRDNGPPIPGNETDPLFSDGDPNDTYHGTGLGLWLVYWVVDVSEGELSFDCSGEGNVVEIRLPRSDAPGR